MFLSSGSAMSHTESVIAKVHDAIATQVLTTTRIVTDCLDRIQAWDQEGPELNAVVAVNKQAMDAAQQLDDAFAQTRTLVGPLHGVPVLIKDNFHTQDMP